jgi:hypothetical protein
MVVYHGTGEDFDEFMFSNDFGYHVGNKEQAERLAGIKESGRVMPLFLNIKNPVRTTDALWYAMNATTKTLNRAGVLTEAEIAKLEKLRAKRGSHEADIVRKEIPALLRAKGYDGVVYENEAEAPGDSYIALSPNQIKSATDNAGTFNGDTGKFLFSTESEDGSASADN